MQIKVLKTKNCRAELAQLIFEEIGIDSKIVIGKIKLPIELESKVLENQWIVIFGDKVRITTINFQIEISSQSEPRHTTFSHVKWRP